MLSACMPKLRSARPKMNVNKIDRKFMRVLPSLDIWDDFRGVRYTVKT